MVPGQQRRECDHSCKRQRDWGGCLLGLQAPPAGVLLRRQQRRKILRALLPQCQAGRDHDPAQRRGHTPAGIRGVRRAEERRVRGREQAGDGRKKWLRPDTRGVRHAPEERCGAVLRGLPELSEISGCDVSGGKPAYQDRESCFQKAKIREITIPSVSQS